VAEFQAEEQPVFEDRPELSLAFAERIRECDDARADRNGTRVGAVFELLVGGTIEGPVKIFTEDTMHLKPTYPG
jgi:hypothetical protein